MKRLFTLLFILSCFSISRSNANMGPQGFKDFSNYYFVETGTFGGNSVMKALETGRFQEIYSMDIDLSFVLYSRARFPSNPHVHIVQADSSKDLAEIIRPLDKPITFWLDAHMNPPGPKGKKNTPLLEELEQIKHHPIKTHTILIDDLHCCGTILFDFLTKKDIIRKVLEINPDYIIEYVAGGDDGEYPNNVLVARAAKLR